MMIFLLFSNRLRVRSSLAVLFTLLIFPPIASSQSIEDWVGATCEPCAARMTDMTGAHILERGEQALMGRAWLTQHATESIDIQYFIWSTDNIGILAAEMLLEAADRGVMIRVLVDDFLIDAQDNTLLMLAAHPYVDIRIYNPNFRVGTSFARRMLNSLTNFRGTNQRMHDKTAIYDGVAGITGGRNMADEYFDFDHEYNFRDRDVLLLGVAVQDMSANFQEFWESPLAVPVEELLQSADGPLSDEDVQQKYRELHAYARDPANFEAEIRSAIENMPIFFPQLLQAMVWHDVRFISDAPGKNSG